MTLGPIKGGELRNNRQKKSLFQLCVPKALKCMLENSTVGVKHYKDKKIIIATVKLLVFVRHLISFYSSKGHSTKFRDKEIFI